MCGEHFASTKRQWSRTKSRKLSLSSRVNSSLLHILIENPAFRFCHEFPLQFCIFKESESGSPRTNWKKKTKKQERKEEYVNSQFFPANMPRVLWQFFFVLRLHWAVEGRKHKKTITPSPNESSSRREQKWKTTFCRRLMTARRARLPTL